MKILKKISISFALFIVVLLGIIFLTPVRHCTFPMDGNSGISESIDESKKINVFVAQYSPNQEITILDSISELKIKEVWIEHSWIYTKDIRYPKINKSLDAPYNLIIKTEAHSLKNHLKQWWLYKFYNLYPGNDDGTIVHRELLYDEISDTINVVILKYNIKEKIFKDTVNKVTFYKKK